MLLRDHLARAAEFLGKVLELRQPVLNRQDRFLIVEVDAGLEVERRDRGVEHVDHAERWMTGHDVTAACLAILAFAHRRFREHGDLVGSFCDLHRVGLPEAEGVEWAARPGAAGLAMAIAHRLRRSFDFDLDCTAKAGSLVSHRVLADRFSWTKAPASLAVSLPDHFLKGYGTARPAGGRCIYSSPARHY